MRFGLLFLFLSVNLIAQVNPIELNFIDSEPEWLFFSRDSNYVAEDLLWATPYSNRLFAWADKYGDETVLIFEQNVGPENGLSGYSLFGLNKETGEQNFVFHNNSNNGLMYNEIYLSEFYQIDDNILTIYGYRSDIPHPNNYLLFHHGSPIKKTIDLEELRLLETQVGLPPDTISLHGIFTPSNEKQIINKNGEHLHLRGGGEIIDNEAINYIKFWPVDESLSVDSSGIKEIQFNTNIPTTNPFFASEPLKRILNDSMMVVVNTVKNVSDANQSPALASVSWWNISSINDIRQISEYDITEHFPKQFNPYENIILETFEEDLVITQFINEEDVDSGLEKYAWLSWHNKEEGLVAELKIFGDNEKNYSHLTPATIIEDKLIFIAFGENSNRVYYDFYALEKNQASAIQIGSVLLEVEDEINYNRLGNVSNVASDLSICFTQYDYLLPNGVSTRAILYMAFDFSDLLSNNINHSFEDSAFLFNVFPNPSNDNVNVKFEEKVSGLLSIMNINGGIILEEDIYSSTFHELNISHLPEGPYLLKFIDRGGKNQIKLFHKI